MVRVLHVIPSLNFGGAERALSTLTSKNHGLVRPHEMQIATILKPGDQSAAFEPRDVTVQNLGAKGLSDILSAIPKLSERIKTFRPDVVHSWLYHADLVASAALWQSGRRDQTKFLWSIRNAYADHATMGWKSRIASRICASFANYPDMIVSNSHAGVRVHGQRGYPVDRICVIPNGIDTDLFQPCSVERKNSLRQELGFPLHQPIVLHVGRVAPVKNHAAFLEVARSVKHASFIAIGHGTEHLAGPSNFRGLGPSSCVQKFYQLSDITLVSSQHEGFPNVVAESMACGTPVISTDCGDAGRIIGPTGKVVASNDAAELARKLETVLSCTNCQIDELSKSARKRINENYSLEKFIVRFDELYSDLTKSEEASTALKQ